MPIDTFSVILGLKMNTQDLLKCLGQRTLGPHISFLGVFCSDQLNSLDLLLPPKKPFMLITNTLKSDDPPSRMGHWVVLYGDRTKVLFLDSFGFPPVFYGEAFSHFMTKVGGTMYAFKEGFQGSDALTCGLYAIFFIHYTSRHGLVKCIQYTYHHFRPSDKVLNDTLIKQYFALDMDQSCQLWLSPEEEEEKAMSYGECMTYKVSYFFFSYFFYWPRVFPFFFLFYFFSRVFLFFFFQEAVSPR